MPSFIHCSIIPMANARKQVIYLAMNVEIKEIKTMKYTPKGTLFSLIKLGDPARCNKKGEPREPNTSEYAK